MVTAFIMIKTAAGKSEGLLAAIRDHEGVTDAHIVAGQYDIIVEAVGDVGVGDALGRDADPGHGRRRRHAHLHLSGVNPAGRVDVPCSPPRGGIGGPDGSASIRQRGLSH